MAVPKTYPVRSALAQNGETLLPGDLVGVGESWRTPLGPERFTVLSLEESPAGNQWARVRSVTTRTETRINTRELRRVLVPSGTETAA